MNLPKSSVLRSTSPGTEAARQLLEQEEQVEAQYRILSDDSFLLFCRGLYIKAQTGKKRFERVMAPFQRTCFENLASSLEQLRDGAMPDKRRWWIERTKKASKDADLAVVIAWLVAFPTRPFYGQIGAADRGQAGIVRDRLSDLLFYNCAAGSWLTNTFNIQPRRNSTSGTANQRFSHLRISCAPPATRTAAACHAPPAAYCAAMRLGARPKGRS